MSRMNKASCVLVLFAGLVLALGGALFVSKLREPLPLHDGSAAVPGLDSPVEILRDEWGVPHIYASNAHDLFFSQGYTQAQDRWWQMELCRLASQGRLGELMGKSALASDVQVRALGLKRISTLEWQRYDVETASYLKAFADGVNAYLSGRNPDELAVEYSALRLKNVDPEIEPWSPVDTLIYARFLLFQLSAKAADEEAFERLRRETGPAMVEALFQTWDYEDRPTILEEGDYPFRAGSAGAGTGSSQAQTNADGIRPAIMQRKPDLGSNGWAVSGRLTQSGHPLIAYDSHLATSLPSPWFQIGLHCDPVSAEFPFDVSGFSSSLFPGIAVGHNGTLAWGFTASNADVQDYYEIRVGDDDPLAYQWNGAWREMSVFQERFSFAGSEPISLTMRLTHLGPIVNDFKLDSEPLSPADVDSPLALPWVGSEPAPLFQPFFAIIRAENRYQFQEALHLWRVGPLHYIYADAYGNIGYQMTGDVPIRAGAHSGLAPVPGWTDAYEWQGTIPFELLPQLLNPARGYIINADQSVAPPSYWDFLKREIGTPGNVRFQAPLAADGCRARRIAELLNETRPHSGETFRAMQLDDVLLSARDLLPLLAEVSMETRELIDVRDWLVSWNGRMEVNSAQAALYALLWRTLVEELYADNLHDLPTAGSLPIWVTVQLLAEPSNPWWDAVNTPEVIEGRDDILQRALAVAYARAVEKLGRNRDAWCWGDLQKATFVNPVSGCNESSIVKQLVNRGPHPIAGASSCINAVGWDGESAKETYFGADLAPVMRMVVDLGAVEESVAINSTGQSGHVASEHYDDMIEPWLAGEYNPMLWERQQVENSAIERLMLYPQTADPECCESDDDRLE